jgi:hypothetical protein
VTGAILTKHVLSKELLYKHLIKTLRSISPLEITMFDPSPLASRHLMVFKSSCVANLCALLGYFKFKTPLSLTVVLI